MTLEQAHCTGLYNLTTSTLTEIPLSSHRCRQRDKHAANAGKLAIGVVDGKRERRPVQRFQPEAPRPEPAGDDGKSGCLSRPIISLIERGSDAATAVMPFRSASAVAQHMLDIMLCNAADLLAAIAASEREQALPRKVPKVRVGLCCPHLKSISLACCSDASLGLSQSDLSVCVQQRKKRRSNEDQPVRARKQQRGSAGLSPAAVELSSYRDDADSEDDMPLGALIAQRRPTAVPAEAEPQPTALAAATSVLPVDAVRQDPDIADSHHVQTHGTAVPDAAPPAGQSAARPDAAAGAAHADGSPGPAQGSVNAPASPVGTAGCKQTPRSVDDGTTPQRSPHSVMASLAKAADQPTAAAAAPSPAAKATVDTAVDVLALQPAATVVPAVAARPGADKAHVLEHVEQQQPQQCGTEAVLSAASVPLVIPSVNIATYSSVVHSVVAATDLLRSELPTDAPVTTVLHNGVHGDLLSNTVSLEVRSDGDTQLLALKQPDTASPAEVKVVAEAPNARLPCAPDAAATPSAASPALLITTQDWHRLLGAGEPDDAAVSPSSIDRAVDVTLLPALDMAVGVLEEPLSSGAVRSVVTSQDVVPDSDTSSL